MFDTTLPNLDRPALREAIDRPALGLLGLTAVLTVAAVHYGGPFLAIEAAILAALTVGCVVTTYRQTLRSRARRAEWAETDARLAAQSEATRVAVATLPALDDLGRDARARLQARADLVALGMACPAGRGGCAEEERESDELARQFLAERAARHGHTPAF